MMKLCRKLVAFVLALTIVFTLPLSVSALNKDEVGVFFHKGFYNTAETLVEGLLGAIAALVPTPHSWKAPAEDALTKHMRGTEQWLQTPAEHAVFSLGFNESSLLDTLPVDIHSLYVGGSIDFDEKKATALLDDLRVRTAALSDGSGRGTGVLLELDAYGLSLPDVRVIRARLADFCKDANIHSVTVAVLHQHSAADTFGMNGDIFRMALLNPLLTALSLPTPNGKHDVYMEHLYATCVASIRAAVKDMKPGKLYYGTADQTPFLIDKRAPYVSDPHFNRFRFVPADGSRETWLVSTEIHGVGNGAGGTVLTSDYPFYAERTIRRQADANVLFYMGAQQSTSGNYDKGLIPALRDTSERTGTIPVFGDAIGQAICAIQDETEVAPLFNVRFASILLPISNPVLLLAGKAGMIGAEVVKLDGGYGIVTEIGYAELGNEFAFAIIPGELAPELAYGGCLQGSEAWSGKDWTYPSLQEMVAAAGSSRKLFALDLANDQIGYIVPDNNYMPMIAPESNSIEFVSLGKQTASLLMEGYQALIARGVS